MNNWKQYFLNPDEGFGTVYERFVLHRYFNWLRARYDIHNVLEAPSFGMTGVSGINSLWWASHGVTVTIVDQCLERLEAIQKVWRATGLEANLVCQSPASALLPFSDRSFDLSWNFAALWHVRDAGTYLKELGRVTRTALYLCVPNQQNICWKLRPHDAADYYLENISIEWIISSLAAHDWRLVETGFFDAPPFPDIAMKKEDFLRRKGFNRLAKWMESKKGRSASVLDYYSGRAPSLERQTMKLGFLENSPAWFKRVWAHHRFLLFERK
jgi:ubiquinone/menaquinone biosynthesis C-methylase UbiE